MDTILLQPKDIAGTFEIHICLHLVSYSVMICIAHSLPSSYIFNMVTFHER